MKITIAALLLLSVTPLAHADSVLSKNAVAICKKKAVRAAHFLSESKVHFDVTTKVGENLEMATPIQFDFRVSGIEEALFTVQAYAYSDETCLIGSIRNNIAGND